MSCRGRNFLRAAVLAVLALGSAPGIADDDVATRAPVAAFDHAGLVRQFVDGYMRVRTAAFAEDATKLKRAVARTCASHSTSDLADAVMAFKSAVASYARIEMVRFGPLRDDNRQERLLLYPDRKGLVRKQVEEAVRTHDDRVRSAKTLATRSVALQGFSALDILLSDTDAPRVLGKDDDGPTRCAFAAAIADNVEGIAREGASAWADLNGYAKLMAEPGATNAAYLKPEEVTLEIFNAFANGIEQIRDVRLAGPIGLKAIDKAPTPGILENSHQTLAIVAANIDGLIALYREGGLKVRLAANDEQIADMVERELTTARDLALKVGTPGDLGKLKADDKTRLIAMGFPLKNAKQLASTLFADSTGLTVGFNAGDGD